MTVYVESNFVPEIALGQRQAWAAELILEGAVQGRLAIAVPSFALCEPFSTVIRRGDKRRELRNRLSEEIRDLTSSLPHEAEVLELMPMPDLFSAIEQREKGCLTEIVQRLFDVATVIEVDARVYGAAVALVRDFGFSKMTDATVCAAVLDHLESNEMEGPHLFATKDASDFSDPDIVKRFEDRGCTITYSFKECAHRLRLIASAQ
jgi:hypothetical protein